MAGVCNAAQAFPWPTASHVTRDGVAAPLTQPLRHRYGRAPPPAARRTRAAWWTAASCAPTGQGRGWRAACRPPGGCWTSAPPTRSCATTTRCVTTLQPISCEAGPSRCAVRTLTLPPYARQRVSRGGLLDHTQLCACMMRAATASRVMLNASVLLHHPHDQPSSNACIRVVMHLLLMPHLARRDRMTWRTGQHCAVT